MMLSEIHKQIRSLLYYNLKCGYSKLLHSHYCYIKPSQGTYPYQWFWDTAMHVFMLCELREYELAKGNIESLFAIQEPDGRIGHMIYWENTLPRHIFQILEARPTLKNIRPRMSSLIQPPLLAEAIERLYTHTHDIDFLRSNLPKLKKYFNWLAENRDIDYDGLLSIVSNYESGIDTKPSFDTVLKFPRTKARKSLFYKILWMQTKNFFYRYNMKKISKANNFLVKEVTFNTIYVLNLESLARLCDELQDSDATLYRKRAKKTSESIIKYMYHTADAAFYDLESHTNAPLKCLTPSIFFPLLLDEISEDMAQKILGRHLHEESEFETAYPFPSVAKNDPAFDPGETEFLWRGPTWVFYDWMMYRIFIKKNMPDEARNTAETLKSLIEKGGFREYYNPFTGEGLGAKDFTWSGLILDMTPSLQ